jgi:methyl-accepting chemotaxis protein
MMTIKIKLLTTFAVPLLILFIIGSLAYSNTSKLLVDAEWTEHTHKVLAGLHNIIAKATDLETGQRGFVITGEERFLQPFHAASKTIYEEFDQVKALTSDNPQQQQRLERIRPLLGDKIAELEETIDLRRDVSFAAALQVVLTDKGKKIMDEIRVIISDMVAEEEKLLLSRSETSEKSANTAQSSIIFGILISTILIAILGFFIISGIQGPLNVAVDVAQRLTAGERDITIQTNLSDETGVLLKAMSEMQGSILKAEEDLRTAEEQVRTLLDSMVDKVARIVQLIRSITDGDLTQRINIEGEDDLAQLSNHLNVMTDALTGITNRIREASTSSLSSLKELEAAIQSQTTGASEQASSVNETTTTLQEIKSISVQTVEKASALGDSAERTREEGSRGLVAIKQTAQSMQDIRTKVEDIATTILGLSEQTQQIGEITALVNKVAEQSKLLALNASIEAAKAGEAGVGFSVVATEVKDLAEQSGQATQQVQKILQDIQRATDRAVMTTEEGGKEVDKGIEMTRQAGEIMQNLSDVITETSTASEQIVAAVRQEGMGIDQIVAAMDDITKVTSQFVAATQQTQSGVDNLVSINSQLDKSVSVYKLAS